MRKVVWIFMLFSFWLSAQESPEKIREVQNKINELQENKDVFAINKLINTSNFLDPEYAYKILNDNLKTAQEHKNEKEIADTYLTFGNFWYYRGNKAKAYENYYECERVSKRIDDLPKVGISIMNRAILTEDTETRIGLYKEAIEILKKSDDEMALAKAHLNIGNAYSVHIFEKDTTQNKLDKSEISHYKKNALQHYASADSLNQNLKNSLISAGVHVYTAEWHKFEKEYPQARKYYALAIKDFENAGYLKGEVNCIIELAHIEKDEKQISKALGLLEKAERISTEYEFNDYLVSIYEEYVKIYTEQGDYKKALEYHQKFSKQNIDLQEQNSKDKIHLLNLEHNMAESKYKLEKYEAQSKTNRILLTTSILLAILIAGLSYFMIQNKKKKIENIEKNKVIAEMEKSAVEIKLKNQLLEDELLKEKVKYSQNKLMTYASQVNKIDSVIEELKNELKTTLTPLEKQKKINALKISFSEVLNDQNELNQINSLSSEFNQEFFFYIRQNYPSITKEDEQLLSYLILNLGNREISRKLNISVKSLYTKRYRLRKKLNLNESEKLLDFYKKVVDEYLDRKYGNLN